MVSFVVRGGHDLGGLHRPGLWLHRLTLASLGSDHHQFIVALGGDHHHVVPSFTRSSRYWLLLARSVDHHHVDSERLLDCQGSMLLLLQRLFHQLDWLQRSTVHLYGEFERLLGYRGSLPSLLQ